MKSQLSVTALIATTFLGLAPLIHAGELTVQVTDIRATRGTLLVAVVNTEAGWNNQEKPVAAQKVAASGAELRFTFQLPAGSYAVQVMHDENDNGRLDANFMGIPVEGYGFSNNPQVMRRALFNEAKFELAEAASTIVVRLR